MTSPFQWIIDNCVDLSINKRGVVAQTTARNQKVRSVSRGGRIWRFTVTPSPGQRWSSSRAYIEAIEKADRFTSTTINFTDSKFAPFFGLQSTGSAVANTVSATQGSDILTVTTATSYGTGDYLIKSGDLLQLESTGSVYTSVEDVLYPDTTIQVNRPVLEATDSYDLILGQAVNWTVVCTQLPDYRIVSYDRIEWSGEFVFVEVI